MDSGKVASSPEWPKKESLIEAKLQEARSFCPARDIKENWKLTGWKMDIKPRKGELNVGG